MIHAADGCIPSDLATKTPEEIDEERRLFYVALTRAQDWLYVTHPLRYFFASRGRSTDLHGYAQLTRFVTPETMEHFERRLAREAVAKSEWGVDGAAAKRASIREQSKAIWL